MSAVGEGFAGFGREGPEAWVGMVAEGVEIVMSIFFLGHGRAVGAYEELVVGVVAGNGGGVA